LKTSKNTIPDRGQLTMRRSSFVFLEMFQEEEGIREKVNRNIKICFYLYN
jgi:hypothetical protein